MARDAEEAAAQATKDIVAATGQIITSGASVVSLFPGGKKTQTDKLFDRQERLDARMLRKTTRNKSV